MIKTLIVLFALFLALLCNVFLLIFLGVNLDLNFYQETVKAFVPNLLGLIFAVVVVETLISINRESSYRRLNFFSSKAIANEVQALLMSVSDLLNLNQDKEGQILQAIKSKDMDSFTNLVLSRSKFLLDDILICIENGELEKNLLDLTNDEHCLKKLKILDESFKNGFGKISAHLEKIKPYPTEWLLDFMETDFSIFLQYSNVLLENDNQLLSKEHSKIMLKAYANLAKDLLMSLVRLSKNASKNTLFAVIA